MFETIRVPGREVEQGGAQPEGKLGQQEHGDHGRERKIELEDVGADELGAVGDTGVVGVSPGQRQQTGIELDADCPCSELRGRDDHPAIARSQVDEQVAGGHRRHLEHGIDEDLRCGHPGRVLPLLTERGLGLLG